MAVFYLISVLSILIVFIVPCIIGTRYMIKKQIAWHIQILWLLLIVLTSYVCFITRTSDSSFLKKTIFYMLNDFCTVLTHFRTFLS